MKKTANVVWNGGGKDGKGRISTESGALKEAPYSASMRFGEEKGTNPEELIAAAHAGCYSMALAFALQRGGHAAEELKTRATVSIDPAEGGGFTITASHLELSARIPGLSDAEFQKIAAEAEKACPVSKVLNAKVTLDAKLAG